MRKNYRLISLLIFSTLSLCAFAQTNPGNPKHQWTFDDGTANDAFGGANATFVAPAVISDKSLNTSTGGYLNLPAATITINSFSAISQEIWFTSKASANPNSTSLSFFGNGNVSGWLATNYLFVTPARNENVSRTAISCLNTSSPWSTETQVDGSKHDDGLLHHFVSIIDATTISMYIDGVFVGSSALSANNQITNLSNAFAYLCRSGYTYEATWKGKVHKYSIFDKALSASEVLYLYQQGAEAGPAINAGANEFLFENTQGVEVKVTGFNLTPGENISITAPSGINLSATSMPYNADKASLTVTWDGSTAVDGFITLTSGTTTKQVPVKSVSNTTCFVPLYSDKTNLIPDPKMYNIGSFTGWGTKEIINIVSEPSNVYCGISSAKVGNGTHTSGSLEVVLNGKVTPNTSYRVKAIVKTIGGDFQLGIWGLTQNQISYNIDTNGEWQTIDFVFKTSATLQPNQYMWWNNSGRTGTLGYIDNWEMYDVSDIVSEVSNLKAYTFNIYSQGGNLISEFESNSFGEGNISIYNLQGLLTQSEKINYINGTNNVRSGIQLQSGVYVVKLSADGKFFTGKLIVN